MSIKIKPTQPSEADLLAKIQAAAFRPLYDRFHDQRNPCLRGPEDILRRLTRQYRYFTIWQEKEIIGGIFYLLQDTTHVKIGPHGYYLGRIYLHPDYQNQGIARQAIHLCEKEFPDADTYFVDFPEVLEKNRRCYQSAGYRDTGHRICKTDTPTLALFRKTATTPFDPAGVSQPMIYEADTDDLPECLGVIHRSFATVAQEFSLTPENCPKHTAFLPLSYLQTQKEWGWRMFLLLAGRKIIGYVSLSEEGAGTFELHHLAVLPEYRHKGFGKRLLDHAVAAAKASGGRRLNIGILEESTVLKNWYVANGFTPVGRKKFDHLPFTTGFLERSV